MLVHDYAADVATGEQVVHGAVDVVEPIAGRHQLVELEAAGRYRSISRRTSTFGLPMP